MADGPMQRAFREACLVADAPIDEQAEFLRASGVSEADVVAMQSAPPRLGIYRALVRNTLTGVVHRLLPQTRARMGDAFDESVSRFLEEVGPKTHYLRDVPAEFLAWATPRWQKEAAPYLVDLATHEIESFVVNTAPRMTERPPTDVAIDRPLLFSSLVRVRKYRFAVHELPDEGAPTARDVALLYYRNDEHVLRTLELSPLAAALVSYARERPLREAIAAACKETGHPMNDDTLASIARLLADLGERGVLLGA